MAVFAPRTFDEMIAAGRFDLVRPGVNARAFPLDPSGFSGERLQIVGFTGRLTIADVLARIKACEWRPARPEQFLAYLASHPDAHKTYAIAALGATGLDTSQPPCVLRVREEGGRRVLETRPTAGMFETYERALIVHP